MFSFLIAQSGVSASQSIAQPINIAQNLSDSLRIMGFGMLGIFCIIGIIILMTWILQKLFPVKKEED